MAKKNLFQDKQWLYEKILENVEDLISVVDLKAKYLYVSPSHKRVLGYEAEELLGNNGLRLFHKADLPEIIKKMASCVVRRKPVSATARFKHSDGHYVVLEGIGVPILNKVGIPEMILVTSRNITERKELEDRIRHLALHDPLTGIPNRLLLEDRIEHALKTAKRRAQRVAVIFLDLDNFKEVNDTYGHAVGDRVLQEVAQRLHASLRGEDTIARLGGDEFMILLPSLHSKEEARSAVKKILQQMRRKYKFGEINMEVTASCGVALYPDHGATRDALFKNADNALYAAKESGRNTYKIYA